MFRMRRMLLWITLLTLIALTLVLGQNWNFIRFAIESQLPPDPVLEAAMRGDNVALRHYLSQGGSVHRRDDNGRTALMFAVGRKNHQAVRLLLEHGADVRAVNYSGRSVLSYAIQPHIYPQDEKLLRMLWEAGARQVLISTGVDEASTRIVEQVIHRKVSK